MENYIALFISVLTFVFTLYQWLVAMNSRKPRIILHGFIPSKIILSPTFNYFQVHLDTWFIINLSELPNTIMSMSMHAQLAGGRKVGKIYHHYLHDPGLAKTMKSPFPIVVLGHGHHQFDQERDRQPLIFEFSGVLSERDVKKLNLEVTLVDQYGKNHRFCYKMVRDFPETKITTHPASNWNSTQQASVLDTIEINHPEQGKKIFQVVYVPNYKVNNELEPHIFVEQSVPYWSGEVAQLSRADASSWKDDESQAVIKFRNNDENILKINLENNVPKSIDLIVEEQARGKICKSIALPQSFIDSFK